MIVSPVCNCLAVRQRQPALQSAPFPARILRAEYVMAVNGIVRSHTPRGALASRVAGQRHDINSEASVVPWLME
jgi:hypothetical protein